MTKEERDELTVSDAMGIIRRDYYNDVSDMAEQIIEQAREWFKEDSLDSSDIHQYVHESIDGSQRVIYTVQAQQCLMVSDNDGAYLDDFGAEGIATDAGIKWSLLAYCAFEADILEHLSDEGFDLNDPAAYFTKDAAE